MQIPVGMIGTIRFTPLDAEGNPAELDGPLSFALAEGSEAFAEIVGGSPEENSVDVQANAAGEITILATGDVRPSATAWRASPGRARSSSTTAPTISAASSFRSGLSSTLSEPEPQ